ncbi:MAG: AI-2E family transporter, partial [Actinomycetota bacterium]
GFATGALHVVLIFVLAPIFAMYLLIDLPKIKKTLVEYLPPDHRDEWLVVGRRCAQVVGGFFRGQLLVATIVGVMSAFAFSLLQLPFWLPIGALAGFFNIIPLVGPFVGGAVAVVVGAFTGGWDMAAWAALAMLIVQQIDNHFISPKVMGKTVSLHPVAVMIALLLGGTLAGFWGILMAVPILGVTKVIAGHYYETRVLGIPDQDPLSPGGLVTEVGKGEPSARVRRGKKEAKGLLGRWRRA